MNDGKDPRSRVGSESDLGHESQPVKCCLDRAAIFVRDNSSAVLAVSGWMVCQGADLVMLQLALPGQATVICRKTSRPDLSSLLPEQQVQQSGFEAELPIDPAANLPELIHFVAHLKDSTIVPGTILLPTISWGGEKKSSGCPLICQKTVAAHLRHQYESFIRENEQLIFRHQNNPKISVIVDCNSVPWQLYATLLTLTASSEQSFEVIAVVAERDSSRALLGRVDGVRVLCEGAGKGRDQVLLEAGGQARGEYIVYLRDTSLLMRSTLSQAIKVFEANSEIGAVGGRILRSDGQLESAGCSLLADGSLFKYGEGADPWGSEFLFAREVDTVPSDFICTTSQLFSKIGDFPARLYNLDYHVADFCLRVKALGKLIYYHPDILVTRAAERALFNGLTKLHQDDFREHFQIIHSSYLIKCPRAEGLNELAARSTARKKARVLCLESSEALSDAKTQKALVDKIAGLGQQGYFVTCYLEGTTEPEQLFERSGFKEFELAGGNGKANLIEFLSRRYGYYDMCVVSSAALLQLYCHCQDVVSSNDCTTLIVYDDVFLPAQSMQADIIALAQIGSYLERVATILTAAPVERIAASENTTIVQATKAQVDYVTELVAAIEQARNRRFSPERGVE